MTSGGRGYSAALARLDALHARCAELELGDLPEWIECRIGEQVRRRLHIGERDEYHPVGYPVVLSRRELDGGRAGSTPARVAGGKPEACDLAGRETCDRSGLQRIEHAGAPSHRAGCANARAAGRW